MMIIKDPERREQTPLSVYVVRARGVSVMSILGLTNGAQPEKDQDASGIWESLAWTREDVGEPEMIIGVISHLPLYTSHT